MITVLSLLCLALLYYMLHRKVSEHNRKARAMQARIDEIEGEYQILTNKDDHS